MQTPPAIPLTPVSIADMAAFSGRRGTFCNSKKLGHETGFLAGASSRAVDKLSFKVINKNRSERRAAFTAG